MKTTTTNRNYLKTAALVLVTLGFNFALLGGTITKTKQAPAAAKFVSATELKADMNILWADNVILTRNVIICIVNFQPGIDVAAAALTRNQVAMADAVALYYGDEAGEKFAKILHKNIVVTADYMIARRSGHKEAFEAADVKWTESANEIIAFLGQTNASCNKDELKTKINEQVQYTKDEITAVKNKDINKGEKAYDNAIKTGTVMAGIFSDGIIKQFPERFEKFSLSLSQK